MARDSYGRICRAGVLTVSPPDDHSGDYIQHLIEDGDEVLKRKPRVLCEVLGDAPPEFDDAIADLLRCMWIDPKLQNVRLRKLAEWLKAQYCMDDIADDVLKQIADENQPDHSDNDQE